jgi:hypothetical protein
MQRNKTILLIAAGIVVLAGLGLVVAACLPYGTLKALADSLMRDGNFKSLRETNAIVFKVLLGAGGLVLFLLAYGIGSDGLHSARAWLGRYFTGLGAFFKALKPGRVEVFSLVALVLIAAVALILRLVPIYDVMTHDESYTFVVFGSTSLFNIVTNYQLPNNHILNSVLIYFSTHLLGNQPWAVRLPALTAGLLLVPATYGLAKSMYDKYTALLGALLVAVLPGAIIYATSGRGYSLVALFTVLSLWLAIHLRSEKNLFAWSLLVLFSALGFYSVPVYLFPFGMVFAWLFFDTLAGGADAYGSKRNFLKYWLLAGLATAILVLLLYTPVFIYSGGDKVFGNHWVTPQGWTGYLPSIPGHIAGFWQEWTGHFSSLWTYTLLLGFLLGLVFHARLSPLRFPLQFAAFLWITALLLIQRPEGVTKIWVFLQAPFMIWCAAGLVGLLKDLRLKFARNLPVAAVLVGAAVLAALAAAAVIVPTIPRRWADKGPTENTVLALKDRLQPQDLIIIDAPFDASVWYYAHLYGLAESRFDQRRPFDRLFVIVSRADGQTVASVLQDRGPDPSSVDPAAAKFVLNFENLDTYLVSHR